MGIIVIFYGIYHQPCINEEFQKKNKEIQTQLHTSNIGALVELSSTRSTSLPLKHIYRSQAGKTFQFRIED